MPAASVEGVLRRARRGQCPSGGQWLNRGADCTSRIATRGSAPPRASALVEGRKPRRMTGATVSEKAGKYVRWRGWTVVQDLQRSSAPIPDFGRWRTREEVALRAHRRGSSIPLDGRRRPDGRRDTRPSGRRGANSRENREHRWNRRSEGHFGPGCDSSICRPSWARLPVYLSSGGRRLTVRSGSQGRS